MSKQIVKRAYVQSVFNLGDPDLPKSQNCRFSASANTMNERGDNKLTVHVVLFDHKNQRGYVDVTPEDAKNMAYALLEVAYAVEEANSRE